MYHISIADVDRPVSVEGADNLNQVSRIGLGLQNQKQGCQRQLEPWDKGWGHCQKLSKQKHVPQTLPNLAQGLTKKWCQCLAVMSSWLPVPTIRVWGGAVQEISSSLLYPHQHTNTGGLSTPSNSVFGEH